MRNCTKIRESLIFTIALLSIINCSKEIQKNNRIFKEVALKILSNDPITMFTLVIAAWKAVIGNNISITAGVLNEKYDKNLTKISIKNGTIVIQTNYMGCSSDNTICCWGKSLAEIHDPTIKNITLSEHFSVVTPFTNCPAKIGKIQSEEFNFSPTFWIFNTELTYSIAPNFTEVFIDKTTISISNELKTQGIFDLSKLNNNILIKAVGEISAPLTLDAVFSSLDAVYSLTTTGILFNISNGIESYEDDLTAYFEKLFIDGSIIRKIKTENNLKLYDEEFKNFYTKIYKFSGKELKILEGDVNINNHKFSFRTLRPIFIDIQNCLFDGELTLVFDNKNFVFSFNKEKLIILPEEEKDREKIEYNLCELLTHLDTVEEFNEFSNFWWL